MGQGELLLSGNTLNLLILKALAAGADHGYAVARWVERTTDDALSLREGSLYPALHRLEKRGLVQGRWGRSELNRRARFYSLTDLGREQLETAAQAWIKLSRAMERVIEVPGESS